MVGGVAVDVVVGEVVVEDGLGAVVLATTAGDDDSASEQEAGAIIARAISGDHRGAQRLREFSAVKVSVRSLLA